MTLAFEIRRKHGAQVGNLYFGVAGQAWGIGTAAVAAAVGTVGGDGIKPVALFARHPSLGPNSLALDKDGPSYFALSCMVVDIGANFFAPIHLGLIPGNVSQVHVPRGHGPLDGSLLVQGNSMLGMSRARSLSGTSLSTLGGG